MSVPLIKLGYLIIRTLSKPISKLAQDQAKNHPYFRSICIRMSEAYHRMEVRLRSRVGDSKMEIRPLNEDKAIQLGGKYSASKNSQFYWRVRDIYNCRHGARVGFYANK